jgi:hypothetical protein
MDVSKLPEWLSVGDRAGTEHIRPEDTLDVDYNLLLERACGKGLASPSIPSWNHIGVWLGQMKSLQDAGICAA